MKTQSIFLHSTNARALKRPLRINLDTAGFTGFTAFVGRIALAGAVALTTVFASVWAALSPAMAQVLSAGIWSAGFVFFALALEPGIQRISPYIATGIALPSLALLGARVAAEFSILAGVVIAAWLAYWIARRK